MASFDYSVAEFEQAACNLCGSREYRVLARRDQNNLLAQVCLCLKCGFMYLNPRMTRDWYDRYYQTAYRDQRAGDNIHSAKKDLDEIFRRGERFGYALANFIAPHMQKSGFIPLQPRPLAGVVTGFTIEVGSSAGGVLSGFKKRFPGLEVMGLEPSAGEAAYAESKGIPTRVSLFEDFYESLPPAMHIICVRTLNHLLDPKRFFIWAHETLSPGGKLILAVLDFRHSAKKRGGVSRAAQIDHPYMFTPETLRLFVEAAGFAVELFDTNESKSFHQLAKLKSRGLTGQHMRVAARKIEKTPFEHFEIPLGLGSRMYDSMRPLALLSYFLPYQVYRLFSRLFAKFR